MVTEGGRLVVVEVELVRDVDAEALVYGLLKETYCKLTSVCYNGMLICFLKNV